MSQYDFGVIDPYERDGSWLADALNQWRDSMYSGDSGGAAPPYVVDGLIWRNTAGAPAINRWYVRLAGVDRELWNIDNTGRVIFPAATVDWTNITQSSHFKASPLSIWSDNTIGIGPGPFDTTWALHIRGNTSGAIIENSVNNQTNLLLKTDAQTYSIGVQGSIAGADAGAWYLYRWYPTGQYMLYEKAGQLGIHGGPVAGATVTVRNPNSNFVEMQLVGAGGEQARYSSNDGNRYWVFGSISSQFEIWDLTAGQRRFYIDSAGGIRAVVGLYSNYVSVDSHIDVATNGHINIWGSGGYLWAGGFVSTGYLSGGPSNAGNLRCFGTANNVCFRWGGTHLSYRVDEALDYPIVHHPIANNNWFGVSVTGSYTLPAGGQWAWFIHYTLITGCAAGVSPGGTLLNFGTNGSMLIWRFAYN